MCPAGHCVILADVNEMEFFLRLQPSPQLRDGRLADAFFRVIDQRQKCGGMLLGHSISPPNLRGRY